MRRGWVGAPMLCLCTTLGQDGLTTRLLVVPCESATDRRPRDCSWAESESPRIVDDSGISLAVVGVAAVCSSVPRSCHERSLSTSPLGAGRSPAADGEGARRQRPDEAGAARFVEWE